MCSSDQYILQQLGGLARSISEFFGRLVPQMSPFHRVEKVFTERINAQSLVGGISIPLVGQIFGGGSDYMCLIFLFI
jgi:hypothetical protein